MKTNPNNQAGWEFAQVQLVKGTLGGLYLMIMESERSAERWKVVTKDHDNDFEEDPPLHQLLAQMGCQGWELIQYVAPNYYLKRRLPAIQTSFHGIILSKVHPD